MRPSLTGGNLFNSFYIALSCLNPLQLHIRMDAAVCFANTHLIAGLLRCSEIQDRGLCE